MHSLHRLMLAAILASAAGPAFAGWGPGGHDDAIYPEGEPNVTVGGESLTYGPGIEHDDAIYAQGPVQVDVPSIQVVRGPLPAGKDDTMYAGDYLAEQPLPGVGATSAVGALALCTCNSSGHDARSTDTGHHGS